MTSTTAAGGGNASTREPSHSVGHDILAEAATAVALPFTLARQLLPDNPVPVALGSGALAVAGLIEWPAAAAVTLGYLALRRWRRAASAPV